MTNFYNSKFSIFMNSALMSGALVATLTSLWMLRGIMIGA